MPGEQDRSNSIALAMQTVASMLCILESLGEKVDKMSVQLEALCPPNQPKPLSGLIKQEKEFYSVKEVAAIVGISDRTIRRLQKRGFFKSSKALRTKQIPRSEIDRYRKETV